jgi:hypothetical protein
MRPTIPVVKILLDRERTLRFDFNALASFEDATGLSALEPGVWMNPNAKILRALLWAAMLHEDETITIKEVGAMLHPGNIKDVNLKIREASFAASPESPDEVSEDERKNANLPTG